MRAPFILLALISAMPALAAATRSRQPVPGDRVMDGAFSPGDDSLAYVELGQKRFTESGEFGFDVVAASLAGSITGRS